MDENGVGVENEESEKISLKSRVFNAASEGLAITLYALLAEQCRPEQKSLLEALTEDKSGQICTPLIIAARNGHEKAVHTLVSKFQPNLESAGRIKFGGHVIDGATALWCAAGTGHLKVVKTLVKAGADVNRTTETNSTPLRAACFEGRLDIVRFLIEVGGANLHIANKYNNTCLMIAAFRGHSEVAEYLLNAGADPNIKANCGATALHFSSECGRLNIVKMLLDHHGALMTKNEHNMTPLMAAAERCQEDVVSYLITRPEVSKLERIEALELLGASFANDKENYDIAKCVRYLKKAMLERWESRLMKPVVRPVAAYDNWIETETLEDLMNIENDAHSLHMEGLTIRERILGPENPEVPHPVIFRGAVFADSARFEKCIQLWLHSMRLRQRTGVSVVKDLLRFAQVFSQILHVGVELEFPQLLDVLAASAGEIKFNLERITNPGPKDEPEILYEEIESNMTVNLYLIVILAKIRKSLTAELYFEAMKHIFEVVSLRPKTIKGASLLHLAVDSETRVDDFHTNDIVHFPCAATTKILLEAGADVQDMDEDGNTPLHIIVSYKRIATDFLTLHGIIMGLLEAGAHVDVVNKRGKTPLESAATGVTEIILKSQAKLSLKCLAAQSVKKHGLSYQGQVPQTLEHFIELHGP